MADPMNRVATYEDLFNLPDNVVGEIFSGELVTHPRPSPRHSRAASMVGVLLGGSFDFKTIGDDDGRWILDEPECHLGDDIVVPDIVSGAKLTCQPCPKLHGSVLARIGFVKWFHHRLQNMIEV